MRAATDGSAPCIAGIGLQYFSEVRPADPQELFVGDAGRGKQLYVINELFLRRSANLGPI